MRNVKYIPGEIRDDYETLYVGSRNYDPVYYYQVCLLERVHSDFNKYFVFRKAKGVTTIQLYRIKFFSPEYYEFKNIDLPKMTKKDRDIMIQILNHPSEGRDLYDKYIYYKNTWLHVLHDAETYSDVEETKNPVMPDYNLLPTVD